MIFKNSDGDVITELNFSVQRGSQSPVQAVTIQNPFSVDKNITLYAMESSTNQLGRAIDTYQSQLFSLDNQSFVSSLPVTVPGGGSLVVYTKYSPPDQAVPGECEWTFHHEPNEDYGNGPLGLTEHATVPITGSTDGDLTNRVVRVTIPYQSFMRSDFGDVRFVDNDGSTLLSYNRVSYTASTTATFDVKIPSLPASPSIYTLHLYTGNSSLTDASDPRNVYYYFEDWEDGKYSGRTSPYKEWTCAYGTPTILNPGISGNYSLKHLGPGSTYGTYYPGMELADTLTNYQVEFEFQLATQGTLSSTPYLTLWHLRIQSGGNVGQFLRVDTYWSGSNQMIRLMKREGTSDTTIKTATLQSARMAAGTNYHFKIVDNGSSVTVTANGTDVLTTTYTTTLSMITKGFGGQQDSAGIWENIAITQLTTNPPTVGSLSNWEQISIPDYDLEVKAGIQYAQAEIEGLDYNPSFGVWIGDQYYE